MQIFFPPVTTHTTTLQNSISYHKRQAPNYFCWRLNLHPTTFHSDFLESQHFTYALFYQLAILTLSSSATTTISTTTFTSVLFPEFYQLRNYTKNSLPMQFKATQVSELLFSISDFRGKEVVKIIEHNESAITTVTITSVNS